MMSDNIASVLATFSITTMGMGTTTPRHTMRGSFRLP
jgi:hypothetical protein